MITEQLVRLKRVSEIAGTEHASPAHRRISLAFFVAGLATLSLLYCVLSDLGAGGMEIPIVPPRHCLPIVLDVGTKSEPAQRSVVPRPAPGGRSRR
jgi:hypothetical protein